MRILLKTGVNSSALQFGTSKINLQQSNNAVIHEQCASAGMNDRFCSVTSYLLFLICRIDEYLYVLLHGIFYPFISANKAFRLCSSFTWCSYCLICMFLSNVLLTIVLRFVLFILAIVLSVCLPITAIDDPLYIFGSFSYL